MSQIYGHRIQCLSVVDDTAFDSLITTSSIAVAGYNGLEIFADITRNAATAIRFRFEASHDEVSWFRLQHMAADCAFQNTTGEGLLHRLYDLEVQRDFTASVLLSFIVPVTTGFVRLLIDGTAATGTDTVIVHLRAINNSAFGGYSQ